MLRRSSLMLAILVLLPAAASADSFTFYGLHTGFTQGPDQVLVGGQLQFNGVAPHTAFVPGVDVGIGNDLTLVTLNGDFHCQLARDTRWQPYVGAGVGMGFESGPASHNGDTQPIGHLIVGAAVPNTARGRFFTELILGLGDATELKAAAGWNLRSR